MTPLPSARQLTKQYGGRNGCHDVSFDLYPGEVLCIVGESGSGKTTLLNTLALRMSLSGRQSIAEMLEEVRGKVVGGFAHQEVPFDRVVEEVSPERSGSQNPLFQVAFSYQDAGTYGGEGSMGLEEGMVYEGVSKFDVTLTVREGAGGGLMCWLEYSSELYEEEKMHRLVCHYKELARGVSEAAEVEEEREVRMGSLEMLSGAERIEQLAHWQGMETADGPMPTLVDLMAKTVASNAGADALRYAGEVVSYGELWRRSGAVAFPSLRSRAKACICPMGIWVSRRRSRNPIHSMSDAA